jgi:hypothetical protein
MKIRPMEIGDVDALITLARIYVQESRFNGFPFDEVRVRASLLHMINSPRSDHFSCVAHTSDKKITGALIGSIGSYFFCDRTVATSVFFFVDPAERGGFAALKLILAFRAWANNRQASELYIGIASGVLVERTGKFLQRIGMRFTGGNYSMWLNAHS